jgi:hypothetical protein
VDMWKHWLADNLSPIFRVGVVKITYILFKRAVRHKDNFEDKTRLTGIDRFSKFCQIKAILYLGRR